MADSFPQNVENGVIGEDRTRGLLTDRFYVFNIQPDVYGSDHFVLLKDLTRSPAELPRIAKIQSKFMGKRKRPIVIPWERAFKYERRLKDTALKGWRPQQLYFVVVHSGDVDNETVYFFTVEELIEDGYVDFDNQKITIKINKRTNKDRVYKGPNMVPKISEMLNIIQSRIEDAETLESAVFNQQLAISATDKIYTKFTSDWKHYDEFNIEFQQIKQSAAKHLQELENYVKTVRMLTLETVPETAYQYYHELTTYGDPTRDAIEKASWDATEPRDGCLAVDILNFHRKFIDPNADIGP